MFLSNWKKKKKRQRQKPKTSNPSLLEKENQLSITSLKNYNEELRRRNDLGWISWPQFAEPLANRVQKSNTWVNSSTQNDLGNALRGCGHICHRAAWRIGWFSTTRQLVAFHMWVPSEYSAGSKRGMPVTQCHFFIHITLEFRWWQRTRKVNLLLQESQYFTITLGSDLKGHFVHTIYFFVHMDIAIHCHGYLEAE